jgi:hypothetical protein
MCLSNVANLQSPDTTPNVSFYARWQAWEALLATEYHQSYVGANQTVMRALGAKDLGLGKLNLHTQRLRSRGYH